MIKLNRLTDYAVTLLTQIVGRKDGVWAASDLAEKTGLPLPTVSKVLKQLTRAGILQAQRGPAGGYHLARPPGSISVASIVEAMDGPIAITKCADGGAHDCGIERICPMSGNWNRVNLAVKRALENVSLADMAHPAAQP